MKSISPFGEKDSPPPVPAICTGHSLPSLNSIEESSIYYLILKFEIIQIVKKYSNAKFFVSPAHYEMIKQFSQSIISLKGKKPPMYTNLSLDIFSN